MAFCIFNAWTCKKNKGKKITFVHFTPSAPPPSPRNPTSQRKIIKLISVSQNLYLVRAIILKKNLMFKLEGNKVIAKTCY